MRVLHVASEVVPLVKTGGLADVAGALPAAQRGLGADARLLVPGYPMVIEKLSALGLLHEEVVAVGPAFSAASVRLLSATLPGTDVPLIVLDAPWLYRRGGDLYTNSAGQAWADNHLRFGLLGWIAAQITAGDLLPGWEPDVLHCHDWHAGLAPAYLAQHPVRSAKQVFTIHNLAFQGLFPTSTAGALMLSDTLISPDYLEFHSQLSFIKAGLVFADLVTTVSPTYAKEILRPENGQGLDGLLRHRSEHLIGVLNGIDMSVWDPSTDSTLDSQYSIDSMGEKTKNRRALQAEFGLPEGDAGSPVFAVVSRLSAQKGLDILIDQMPAALQHGCQFVVLGTGDAAIETALKDLATRYPDQASVKIGFDEALAHRIYGGADGVIVPSQFEPCGLTQLYGLRYGAVPIVTPVGGLADTVIDERASSDKRRANGFVHDAAEPFALTLIRAIDAFRDPARWQALVHAGMTADNSWEGPAANYLEVYRGLAARSTNAR